MYTTPDNWNWKLFKECATESQWELNPKLRWALCDLFIEHMYPIFSVIVMKETDRKNEIDKTQDNIRELHKDCATKSPKIEQVPRPGW